MVRTHVGKGVHHQISLSCDLSPIAASQDPPLSTHMLNVETLICPPSSVLKTMASFFIRALPCSQAAEVPGPAGVLVVLQDLKE